MSLFRSPLLCPIGIACAVPLLLFLVMGKSYYAVGTVPIVMTQGLMAISKVKRPQIRAGLQIAVVLACALEFVSFVQLTLLITPATRLYATGLDGKNELFAHSVGWNDIAQQVQTMYGDLPTSERNDTVIIAAYYGVPGALWIYGDLSRLPAVMSPQLSEWYWLPKHLTETSALMVDYQPSDVSWMCSSSCLIGHLTVPYDVTGLEQGAPVMFCQLSARITELWGWLRDFS